jgi:hypothetical protein
MPSVRLGRDSETGQEVRIGDIERRSGLYVLGKPGMGKSALMVNMMREDAEHGHGLFFLDPHGDAITDLARRLPEKRVHGALLFDPSDETHSFGINLLHCANTRSLKEREETYTRAYNVFYKLWEEQWGVWLQLILQNVLRAFIENQAYTLADVPLFLNPRNFAFREHILRNVTHNPAVVDFWRSEFFERRERDQQERVDAALTRINTLLTNPYVRHIVGQQKTTINFENVLKVGFTLLMRLSANFPEDVKRFIGTILFSELLHAVRNREQLPEAERTQYCIFIDEFQNFANSDDIRTLITEGRKFGVTIVFAHQERFGQFAENQRLMGATLATASKALFQATVIDAGELAPEVAEKVEPSEIRREAELVLSPRPVEDLWERGHPEAEIMYVRDRYLWIVEELRSKPQQQYALFDPIRLTPKDREMNPVTFRFDDFADWEWYRSSADMLRQAISLLNRYHYEVMGGKYDPAAPLTDAQVQLILTVLECLGGVFGFLPMMEPVISEPMRYALWRVMGQYQYRSPWRVISTWEELSLPTRLKVPHYDGYKLDEITLRKAVAEPSFPRSLIPYEQPEHLFDAWHVKWWPGHPLSESDFYRRRRLCRWLFQPVYHGQAEGVDGWIEGDHTSIHDIPTTFPDIALFQGIRQLATFIGMSPHELEQLITWEVKPLERQEKEALDDLVILYANKEANPSCFQQNQSRIHRNYATALNKRLSLGNGDADVVTERLLWQMGELVVFLDMCLCNAPKVLRESPVKTPSGKYTETLKVERTQQDLINEMAMELASLPQYTAYAKLIAEQNGMQRVLKHKIQTLPLPPVVRGAEIEDALLEKSHVLCQEREAIEAEIRERQDRWRPRPTQQPPDEPPPPTGF